jgi:hypothetical protein
MHNDAYDRFDARERQHERDEDADYMAIFAARRIDAARRIGYWEFALHQYERLMDAYASAVAVAVDLEAA